MQCSCVQCSCLRACACVIVRVRSCTYECMYERRCECVGYPPMFVYSCDMCVCFALLPFDKSHRLIGVSMVRQHAQPHLRDCAALFWCKSCASPSSRPARLSWPGALQDPMRSQEVSPAPFPAVHSSSQLLAGTSCRSAEKQGMQHAQQVGIANVPC